MNQEACWKCYETMPQDSMHDEEEQEFEYETPTLGAGVCFVCGLRHEERTTREVSGVVLPLCLECVVFARECDSCHQINYTGRINRCPNCYAGCWVCSTQGKAGQICDQCRESFL